MLQRFQTALNLHLKLLAFPERRGESGQQFGNHFQILQANDFDRRMHIPIRKLISALAIPPRVQKMASVSVPLVVRHGLVLQGNFFCFGHRFNSGDDIRMIAAAMGNRRPLADSHIAMLNLFTVG